MNNPTERPQPAAAVGVSPRRDHALDALRTLAVLGMMAAHTARLMPFDVRPGWARLVLLVEPVIPSLFLFLVGLSLATSFARARRAGRSAGAWYARQLKRAAALWAVSAVFFTLELGPRLPDALLAGGILANIAYAIAIAGGLLALTARRAAVPVLAAALLLGACLYVGMDMRGVRIHPVNIGNSPFLPLWLFALAGSLWGVMTEKAGPRGGPGTAWRVALGLAAATLAWGLVSRYGLEPLFSKPFGRSDAGRLAPASLLGAPAVHLGYYNLRPMLTLACFALHASALSLLGAALARLREGVAARLFALGRSALLVYILHLALLALFVVASGERQPLSTGLQGTAMLLALIAVCQGMVLLRRSKRIVHFGHLTKCRCARRAKTLD